METPFLSYGGCFHQCLRCLELLLYTLADHKQFFTNPPFVSDIGSDDVIHDPLHKQLDKEYFAQNGSI